MPKSHPTEVEAKKSLSFEEVDKFAAIRADPALSGLGQPPRRRQEAANLFPEALREGSQAAPPYAAVLDPKSGEYLWATQDPARGRANEAEKNRQRRNDVKTRFLSTGQLAFAFLRYVIAGEIGGPPDQPRNIIGAPRYSGRGGC